MTIVVGVVCHDGVVIACDSQMEYGGIKKYANKVYKLNKNIAIAGAGTVLFIRKAIDGLRKEIEERERKENRKLSIGEVADLAEGVMLNLHKVYDVERWKFLMEKTSKIGKIEGMEELVQVFLMMSGVEEKSDGELQKHLYLLYKEGVAEPHDDYCATGSGTPYAEYLLSKYYNPQMTCNMAKKLAVYVIEEVKRTDAHAGGPVNVVMLGKNSYHNLEEAEITDICEELRRVEDALGIIRAEHFFGTMDVETLCNIVKEKLPPTMKSTRRGGQK